MDYNELRRHLGFEMSYDQQRLEALRQVEELRADLLAMKLAAPLVFKPRSNFDLNYITIQSALHNLFVMLSERGEPEGDAA